MAEEPKRRYQVRLTDEQFWHLFDSFGDHPHRGESGTLVDVKSVGGAPMGEVELDSCPHGVSGCFVDKGNIRTLSADEDPLG
jgi:hypothetical protein